MRPIISILLLILVVIFSAYVVFRLIERSELLRARRNAEVEILAVKTAFFDQFSVKEKVFSEEKLSLLKQIESLKLEKEASFTQLHQKEAELAALEAKYKKDLEDLRAKSEETTKKAGSKLTAALMEADSKLKQRDQNCVKDHMDHVLVDCMQALYPTPRANVEIVESKNWLATSVLKYRAHDGLQMADKNVFVCVDKQHRRPDYFLGYGPTELRKWKCE